MRRIPVERPVIPAVEYPTDVELPPLPERLDPATSCSLIAAHPDGGDAFWAAVKAIGTPLVDPIPDDSHRCAVTVVHRHRPDLRSVHALLRSIIEPEQFEASALRLLPGSDVWAGTYRLDARRRGTYSIAAVSSTATTDSTRPVMVSAATRSHLLDAAAPEHRASVAAFLDAFEVAEPDALAAQHRPGGASVMSLPGAPALRWLSSGTEEPAGVVHATLPDGRAIWRYEPEGTDAREPLPILILLDGEDWAIDAPVTIAAMTAAGLLPPLLAVGVGSGDQDARWAELRCSEAFTDYLAHDVLDWVHRARPITADPARTIVAGQSLGGLAALFATQLLPERFGCALVQSGSFWWPADQEWLTSVVRAIPEPTSGVYLSVGTDEWAMQEQVHRMGAALTDRGDPLVINEFCGGHDLACWRVDLADGLAALTARW